MFGAKRQNSANEHFLRQKDKCMVKSFWLGIATAFRIEGGQSGSFSESKRLSVLGYFYSCRLIRWILIKKACWYVRTRGSRVNQDDTGFRCWWDTHTFSSPGDGFFSDIPHPESVQSDCWNPPRHLFRCMKVHLTCRAPEVNRRTRDFGQTLKWSWTSHLRISLHHKNSNDLQWLGQGPDHCAQPHEKRLVNTAPWNWSFFLRHILQSKPWKSWVHTTNQTICCDLKFCHEVIPQNTTQINSNSTDIHVLSDQFETVEAKYLFNKFTAAPIVLCELVDLVRLNRNMPLQCLKANKHRCGISMQTDTSLSSPAAISSKWIAIYIKSIKWNLHCEWESLNCILLSIRHFSIGSVSFSFVRILKPPESSDPEALRTDKFQPAAIVHAIQVSVSTYNRKWFDFAWGNSFRHHFSFPGCLGHKTGLHRTNWQSTAEEQCDEFGSRLTPDQTERKTRVLNSVEATRVNKQPDLLNALALKFEVCDSLWAALEDDAIWAPPPQASMTTMTTMTMAWWLRQAALLAALERRARLKNQFSPFQSTKHWDCTNQNQNTEKFLRAEQWFLQEVRYLDHAKADRVRNGCEDYVQECLVSRSNQLSITGKILSDNGRTDRQTDRYSGRRTDRQTDTRIRALIVWFLVARSNLVLRTIKISPHWTNWKFFPGLHPVPSFTFNHSTGWSNEVCNSVIQSFCIQTHLSFFRPNETARTKILFCSLIKIENISCDRFQKANFKSIQIFRH